MTEATEVKTVVLATEGTLRHYAVNPISAENLRRSLSGAAARSKDGLVCVMVRLKEGSRVPDDIDVDLLSRTDRNLFEGWTDGELVEGSPGIELECPALSVLCLKPWRPERVFENISLVVSVGAIESLYVSYFDKFAEPDPLSLPEPWEIGSPRLCEIYN